MQSSAKRRVSEDVEYGYMDYGCGIGDEVLDWIEHF